MQELDLFCVVRFERLIHSGKNYQVVANSLVVAAFDYPSRSHHLRHSVGNSLAATTMLRPQTSRARLYYTDDPGDALADL